MAVGLFAGYMVAGNMAVGRFDVTPSGGSTHEKPTVVVTGQTPGAGLFSPGGNRGDWNIRVHADAENPTGTPLLQAGGVALATLDEAVPTPRRGGLEVAGKLTTKLGNGGLWVAGFTAAGNGAEANYDFSMAYFPFADGWIGAHVAADGETLLGSGNLPKGTAFSRYSQGTFAGEIFLRMPGVHAVDDGMLFAVAAGNGDNVAAVGPMADGSGWHIRIADESHNYQAEERGPFSVLFLPYATPGLVGGWIGDDGAVRRGKGEFISRHTGPGRYEIYLPGRTAADGILLCGIYKMTSGGVEDNALAAHFDAAAASGKGAFVVETYDQPAFADQDVSFCFAFVPFAGWPAPKTTAAAARKEPIPKTWDAAITEALAHLAGEQRLEAGTRYWESPLLHLGDQPVEVRFPVTGLKHIWLSADAVDDKSGDHAGWGDPCFVMADGSRRALIDLPWIASRVGWGKVERGEMTMGSRVFKQGIMAHANSVIGVAVPAGARELVARVGICSTGNEQASVRFRLGDMPYRRSVWADRDWPRLKRLFPTESEWLIREIGSLGRVPASALTPAAVRAASKRMRAAIGRVANRVPAPDTNDLSRLLATFGELARFRSRVAEIREKLWKQIPLLSRVMDYPDPSFDSLLARLQRLVAVSPTKAAEAKAKIAAVHQAFDAYEATVAGLLDGTGKKEMAALRQAAVEVEKIAGWVDKCLGWTTYAGDNQRSGISRESLVLPLRLGWVHTPVAPPAPAWPPPRTDNPTAGQQLSPTLTYDRAFHPVMTGDYVVFSSSSEDAVICLRAEDGKERWRYLAEGPVRLPPVIWEGMVLAGGDDGYLVCLDLETGTLLWRYCPGGGDRRLAGNGRIISQWPIRCGLCVDGETVYLAAGLFPRLGTWLCAVDARSGKEMWKVKAGCSPQGHMLLSPTRIFVPTGRTPFQVYERATGKRLGHFGRSNSWGKDLPGGCCAVVINESLVTGPGEGGRLHVFDVRTTESVVRTQGRRLIVDGLVSYLLGDKDVAALARKDYLKHGRARLLWRVPCSPSFSMIKVDDYLLLGGGDGQVTVLKAGNGATAATLHVSGGRVEGLAYAEGALYVSTADGAIHCFRSADNEAGPVSPVRKTGGKKEVTRSSSPSPEAKILADYVARNKDLRRGYALLLGQDSPALADALLESTALRVILATGEATAASTWRRAYARRELLGTRVEVHTLAGGAALPYRPYLFDVVITGDAVRGVEEPMRVTRPCGGRLCLVGGAASLAGSVSPESFETLPGPDGAAIEVRRRRCLPGAGEWTHGYADAANTACSHDTISFGPMEILWFGRPGPRFMLQRHIKGAAPLYQKGVLFVTGKDYLAGVNAFNGTVLWERHDAGSGRMAMLKDCGNMTVADEKLYVADDEECHVIDAWTGVSLATWHLPDLGPEAKDWGYIAADGELLLGSGTRAGAELQPGKKEDFNTVWYNDRPVVTSLGLFAVRRQDGTSLWRYVPATGGIVNPTITILNERICFVESTNPKTRMDEDGKSTLAEIAAGGARLTALDIKTGKPVWSVPFDMKGFDHAIYMSGAKGILVLTGTRHDDISGQRLIQYRLVGVDVADGKERYRTDHTPTRANILNGGHGEQTQHPAIVGDRVYGPGFVCDLHTGQEVKAWKWNKSPQCATLSTSASCAFSRQGGLPTMASFADGKQEALTRVTRPGCWINTLPVGGIVLIPEASSGCTCGYSIQTSLALYRINENKKK